MRALAFLAAVVACGGHTDSPPSAAPPPPTPPPPVALAIVMYGAETYVGSDDVINNEEDSSRYPGILKGLKRELTALDLVHKLPANSLGELIVYNDAAKVRVPMGPIANLTGEALGTQKDYFHTLGSSLVQAVELAGAELRHAAPAKKVLVIIGDGNDTNNDTAKPALAKLASQYADLTVHAIIYKGPLKDNSGKVVIPAGVEQKQTDIALESMDYLVDGVVGKTH